MERFEHGGNRQAHPGCLDFSANLNPLGMPPAVRDALIGQVDTFGAYPDPTCATVARALAAFEDVDEGWVLPCAGATDALFRLCRVMRPRKALVCAPCYSGYEQAVEWAGGSVVRHRLREEDGFAADVRLADAFGQGIDMAFVANPNNPTGRSLPRHVLLACLERARDNGTLVVLDECFVDLTDGKRSNDLLGHHPNVVIVKALTKSHCLAGLRLGHVLCADASLLERLRDAGQPWAVSVPAQVAGVACGADDGYLSRARELVRHERARLARALRECGMGVVEGDANFLLFKGPVGLDDVLLARGILVRSCGNFVGLSGTWYRVAVRTPQENACLIAALREVVDRGLPVGDGPSASRATKSPGGRSGGDAR